PRIGHRDTHAADVLRATLVHRRRIRDALSCEPVAELENADDRRPALAGTRHQIFDVIEVAVRGEDEIDRGRLLHRLWTRGIRREPRIEQKPLATGRTDDERRVSQPGDCKLLRYHTPNLLKCVRICHCPYYKRLWRAAPAGREHAGARHLCRVQEPLSLKADTACG